MDLKVEHKKAFVSQRFDYVKGLICLWGKSVQHPVIYNPGTRKVTFPPSLKYFETNYYSLGFEPDKRR